MSKIFKNTPTSGPGSGTVTSITFNGGLTSTPDPVVATGTATLDQSALTTTDGTIYWTGSKLATTATGTSGQVLTSNGVGVAPTFQAGGGGGGGITTIDGDSGSVTGSTISLVALNGANNNCGSSVNFSSISATAMRLNVTDPNVNTMIGFQAGNSTLSNSSCTNNTALGAGALGVIVGSTDAGSNTAIGSDAMGEYLSGTGDDPGSHTAIGQGALGQLTGGGYNCCLGTQAGSDLLTGSWNCLLGSAAAVNYRGAESGNININANVTPVMGESNTCRIGDGTGTGNLQGLIATFISGIQGVGVTGTAVLVSSSDQLGVAVSSRRFKENIENLNSSKVLDLQPVSFNYKSSGDKSVGLIAEDVADIIPDLVVNDKDNQPMTVKYQDLPIYLLAEIKKLRTEVDALKGK